MPPFGPFSTVAPRALIRAKHVTELQDAVEETGTAIDRGIPETAGVAGQSAVIGPGGVPAWMDAPTYNVRHPRFGAKGDAVTDDAAAIQAAVNAANAAGGGTVLLPTGEYKIGTTITLYSGVTLQGTGQRKARLRVSALAVNAVTIAGTSVAGVDHKVQVTVKDLGIVGPGKASGGTGYGIYIKWASVGINVENVWVVGFGSHGIYANDAYTMTFARCLLDSNGGSGFYGETNINQIVWLNTVSILNTGNGYTVIGGTTGKFLNADAESNGGWGFDLRYCVDYYAMVHCENNTLGGVTLGRRNAGEGCNLVEIHNSHITGTGVAPTGVRLEYANRCRVTGNELTNHTTQDILIDATATRNEIHTNKSSGDPVITNNSASTVFFHYDHANLMQAIGPGLRLLPRTTNPPVFAEGMLWWDDTNNVLRSHNGTNNMRIPGILEGSHTHTQTSIPAHSTMNFGPITVTGATTLDTAILTVPGLVLSPGIVFGGAWVSAADAVTYRLANVTTAAVNSINVASAGVKAKVWKGLA